MSSRSRSGSQAKIRYSYKLQFMMKKGEISYSRKTTIDPALPLVRMVLQLMRVLMRQHPDIFKGTSDQTLQNWEFYYGYEGSREEAERLDPKLSLHELGVFPGSTVTMGPAENF